MNIAKIMVPKANTALLVSTDSVRQGLEKMRRHGYTAIPVVDEGGAYCGCVNEGDFLRHILTTGTLDMKTHEQYQIRDIIRQEFCPPLGIIASEEEVFTLALKQNFVPIVDDRNCFCGIVTRQGILRYLSEQLASARQPAREAVPATLCRVSPLGNLSAYRYVVILSRYQGRFLLSQHRQRSTWETQGGHIEPGETPLEAARRELYEESGAVDYTITPAFDYWACDALGSSTGVVFFAEINALGPLPESEIARVAQFDALPEALTYPGITPVLFRAAGWIPADAEGSA